MPPKKKKRKPRSRARGTAVPAAAPRAEESAEKRRERLEQRREAKAKEMARRRRQQQRARLVRWITIGGLLAAVIWFVFLRNNIPDAIAGHPLEHFDTFTTESTSGTLHTGDAVSYESTPPVSGPHSPQPSDCGVYAQPLRDENMVHTLEHGVVGILYQPEAEAEDIERAEAIVKSYDSHVFSAPYQGLEDPFTIVAWAHLMRLDSFDEAATKEFIEVFRQGGDAPEELPCPLNIDTPFGEAATPTPTPSPGETPVPSESPAKENKKKDDGKG